MKIEFDMKEDRVISLGIVIILLAILHVNYQHWQVSERLYKLMDTEVVTNSADTIHPLQAVEQQCPKQHQVEKIVESNESSAIKIESQDALQNLLQNNQKPSVLFFYMNGCGWCTKMNPVYEQILKNPKFAGINFYKAEGNQCGAAMIIKQMFDQSISGYPTLIFIKDGKYIDKQVGFSQPEQFEQKIASVFSL